MTEFKETKNEIIEIIKKYTPNYKDEVFFNKYGRFLGDYENDFVWITKNLECESVDKLNEILTKLKSN